MKRPPSSAVFRDLTRGPVGKQLLTFALPLFAGSLIQLLYNTVDLMFVGRILGKEASAAVGASGMIVTCILGFFSGLGVGVGVVAATAVGQGAYSKLDRVIHSAAGLTILLSAAFTVLGLLLAPQFLTWMRTPPDVMDSAVIYIRLYLLSLTSIVSYNIGSGILRAMGNSASPMLYQLAGGLANVLGNTLFICVLDWGVRGAARSTVFSQGLAALLTVRRLTRLDPAYRLRLRQTRLEWRVCKQFLTVGIPAAVQSIVVTFSNIIVQTSINRLGVDSIAAFTAYFKVENFIYLPIAALGQAVSTFTSQNVGAHQFDRARSGVKTAIIMGALVTAGTSGLTVFFAEAAFKLFASETEVVALGSQIARLAFPFYFLYVFLEVFASMIRGAGSALPVMTIIVTNMCVVRTCILRLILNAHPSALGIAAVYPLTWACTALCLFLYYQSGRWMPDKLKNCCAAECPDSHEIKKISPGGAYEPDKDVVK